MGHMAEWQQVVASCLIPSYKPFACGECVYPRAIVAVYHLPDQQQPVLIEVQHLIAPFKHPLACV